MKRRRRQAERKRNPILVKHHRCMANAHLIYRFTHRKCLSLSSRWIDRAARIENTCQRNRKTKRRRRTREWKRQEVVNVMRHVFARTQLDRFSAECSVRVLCFHVYLCLFRCSIPNKTDRLCAGQQQLIAMSIKISIKNHFGCNNKTLNS